MKKATKKQPKKARRAMTQENEAELTRTDPAHPKAHKNKKSDEQSDATQQAKEENANQPPTPLTDEALEKEGDPEVGHLSPSEIAATLSPRLISARDRRAYLIDQAERNEAANDEVNAKETEAINEAREKVVPFLDPDQQRESGLETATAEIERHTAVGREKLAESRRQIAEARKEQGNPTPVPGGKQYRDDEDADDSESAGRRGKREKAS